MVRYVMGIQEKVRNGEGEFFGSYNQKNGIAGTHKRPFLPGLPWLPGPGVGGEPIALPGTRPQCILPLGVASVSTQVAWYRTVVRTETDTVVTLLLFG